jgi:hypothetical protein
MKNCQCLNRSVPIDLSHNNFKLYGGSNSGKYVLLRQFVIFLHCCIMVAHKLLILFYGLHKTL